jgi:sulfotransferase family protein
MPAKPNFFIVGAPKCGTTALYEYLRLHPNIFLPKVKEPHFFATDLGAYPSIKRPEDYTRLFADRGDQHLIAGEASVYYLRSSVAIGNIFKFNPDARIIAMLRNPVDMVYSLHSQLLDWSIEPEGDFETAWRLQDRRSKGLDLPRRISSPLLLQYAQVGALGTQVERLLSIFPRAQVKLIQYDDFGASPEGVYSEVIDFLGLPHDERADFPRINENKRARLPWLRDFYRNPPPMLRTAFRGLKRAAGVGVGVAAVKEKIVDLNTVKERRPPLSPEFRAELVEAFQDEVALLSRILDRDLGHWT